MSIKDVATFKGILNSNVHALLYLKNCNRALQLASHIKIKKLKKAINAILNLPLNRYSRILIHIPLDDGFITNIFDYQYFDIHQRGYNLINAYILGSWEYLGTNPTSALDLTRNADLIMNLNSIQNDVLFNIFVIKDRYGYSKYHIPLSV